MKICSGCTSISTVQRNWTQAKLSSIMLMIMTKYLSGLWWCGENITSWSNASLYFLFEIRGSLLHPSSALLYLTNTSWGTVSRVRKASLCHLICDISAYSFMLILSDNARFMKNLFAAAHNQTVTTYCYTVYEMPDKLCLDRSWHVPRNSLVLIFSVDYILNPFPVCKHCTSQCAWSLQIRWVGQRSLWPIRDISSTVV